MDTRYPYSHLPNPKPVKESLNPGVLLIVERSPTGTKTVLADDYIYALKINTYLALKWVNDVRKLNHGLESRIKDALAALPIEVLREYVNETAGFDDENDPINWDEEQV